jgi:hypothetical protein
MTPEPGDNIIWPVSVPDLLQALMSRHVLPVRAGRHVHEPQSIGQRCVFLPKLPGEHVDQAALDRLVQSTGMVGNESGSPIVPAVTPQPAGTVKCMKPSVDRLRCVTDVMKPRSAYEDISIREGPTDVLRLRGHGLDVNPPAGLGRGQQLLSDSLGSSDSIRHNQEANRYTLYGEPDRERLGGKYPSAAYRSAAECLTPLDP